MQRLTVKRPGVRSIIINGIFLSGSKFFTIALRALYVIWLARHFGAELFGILTHSQAWYLLLLNLTGLGIMQILGRAVGQNVDSARLAVNQTLGIRLVAIILVTPLCMYVGHLFQEPPLVRQLLFYFSFALAGRAISAWIDNCYTAYEEAHKVLFLTIIFRTLEIGLGLTALLFGVDIVVIAQIHAVSWMLQGTFAFILLSKDKEWLRPDFSPKELLSLLSKAIPLAITTNVSAWIVSGPIILYRYSGAGPNELGQFGLLMTIFGMLSTLVLSMSMSALPVLSRSHTRADGQINNFISSSFRIIILGGTIFGVGCMGLGETLVTRIVGNSFDLAAKWMGPSMLLLIPYGLANIAMQVLIVREQQNILAFFSVLAAIILGVSIPFLTSMFMFPGAILGLAVGNTLWAFLLSLILFNDLPLTIFHTCRKALCVSLFTLVGYWIVHIWSPVIASLFSAFFFATLVIILRAISRQELNNILCFFNFHKNTC